MGKNGSFVGCGEPGEDTDVEVENCRVVLLGLAPPPPPTRPPGPAGDATTSPIRNEGKKGLLVLLAGGICAAAVGDPTGLPRVMGSIYDRHAGPPKEIERILFRPEKRW